MKKFILYLFTITGFFISCSKSNEDVSSNFINTPEAKSEYDNSNFGVYKGVFVGSTGYIVIYVNNDNVVKATVVIDGSVYTFTPASGQSVSQNQTTSIQFQNNIGYFTFSVSSNGSNPTISFVNVFGHTGAQIIIVKERSATLVKCMEGTFSGSSRGTWNGVLVDNIFKGLGADEDGTYFSASSGVDANGKITNGTTTTGAIFSGSFSGNNGSGSWTDTQYPGSGTWRVTRTY